MTEERNELLRQRTLWARGTMTMSGTCGAAFPGRPTRACRRPERRTTFDRDSPGVDGPAAFNQASGANQPPAIFTLYRSVRSGMRLR